MRPDVEAVEKRIQEIREAVRHCTDMQDDDQPCYHCRQKQFLLDQIDTLNDVVVAMAPAEPQKVSDPEGWGQGLPEGTFRCIRCDEVSSVEGDEGRCLNCT